MTTSAEVAVFFFSQIDGDPLRSSRKTSGPIRAKTTGFCLRNGHRSTGAWIKTKELIKLYPPPSNSDHQDDMLCLVRDSYYQLLSATGILGGEWNTQVIYIFIYILIHMYVYIFTLPSKYRWTWIRWEVRILVVWLSCDFNGANQWWIWQL